MKTDAIDCLIVRIIDGSHSSQSAYYIANELTKELSRKFYYWSAYKRCQKLVSAGILKEIDGSKGIYYNVVKERVACVNDTLFVFIEDFPVPMNCHFWKECKGRIFGPKGCKLWDTLPEKLRRVLKKYYE